ncbi:MAG: hypothetical protein MJ175_08060, partial [Clostridia bacterium]|nr:hypothetical protein [Clostridia bacterium]
QVTDLRAYTESCDGSALIWVNRADTGKAAASAEIEAEIFSSDSHWSCTSDGEPLSFCKDTLKTDENGLCTLETGDDNQAFLLIKHKNDTLIVGAQLAAAAPFDTLYTYLYTDRSVYFSDDTIRFWGILGKSYAGQQIPDTLELTIGSQTRSTTIHVSENGTFEGSFPIEAWTAYGISFSLSDPERGIILSRFVRVTQEDKPIYTMSVAFDKLFYTYGEDATVTVTTSFFDGTPASGLEVMLYPNPYGEQKTLKTGQDGTASYTFRTGNPFQYETATHHSMISVSAELIGMETACLTDYKSALYFHASGCMRIDQISGDCTELYLNHLDTSALKTPADLSYPAFPENTYGVPMNTEVSVTLSKIEHIRIPQKPLYDAIQKKTVTYDRWSDETTLIFQKNMAVTDGKLILEHYDSSDFNGYYLYEIIWHDPVNGHDYKQSVYAVRRSWSGGFESIQCEDIYEVLSDRAVAAVGDTVTAQVFYGGQPDGDITILSVHYKGSKGRCEVIPAGSLSFVFDEDCILGTQVDATVFVNGEYQVLNPLGIGYDYNKQNILDVTIFPDKDSYKPGETAEFTVRAPGAAGGSVLVSIVDEACFALGDQNADPLNSYFSSISAWYYGYTKYVNRGRTFSLFPENQRWYYFNDVYGAAIDEVEESVMEAPMKDAAAPAAGNGGSDVYIRKAFADNPYFASVPLDENGCAVVSMQIPDNITTWRVTACATNNTTSDLLSEAKLGSAVSDTVCTLPFFLNVSACDLYLTDDDVSVGTRAAGTVLGEIQNDEMTYKAVLSDESGKSIFEQTITASVNGYGWFHFGQLPIGDYSVTITGECTDDSGNRYTDGVEVKFSVSETAFIMPVRRTITPAELSSLHISSYPLTLTFHDDSYDLLFTVMNRLWCMGSARYDMAAANYAAVMAYRSFSGDENAWWYPKEPAEQNRAAVNSYYGFIPELEWAEGDPELTARILACVPDFLTNEKKASLIPFYRDLIASGCSDEIQLCAAYLGLAACGEPVLSELYALAAGAGSYPVEAKLYLITAFEVIGDQNAAQAAWEALWEQEGGTDENLYYLDGITTEERIQRTALGLMAAVRIDPDHTGGMVRYLLTHTSAVDTHALEFAAYVTHFTPAEPKDTVFTYSFEGDAEVSTITLRAGEHHTIYLTKPEFEALQIGNCDDSLRITASYGGTAEEALTDASPSKNLKLSKKITPYDEKNGIYLVTISYHGETDRDYVNFTVSDCIPSGARFVSEYYRDYSMNGYLWHKGGQMMSGCIHACRPWSGKDFVLSEAQPYSFDGELSYLIRGAVSGTFFFEGANAISRETGTYAQTECFVIEIGEDGWKIN